MKTAEEWRNQYDDSGMPIMTARQIEDFIKQIQLDAWKQGMTDAVNECVKLQRDGKNEKCWKKASYELCALTIEKLKFERTTL